MMYEGVVQDLIDELGRLPGVGPKSAQRIAFQRRKNAGAIESLRWSRGFSRSFRVA